MSWLVFLKRFLTPLYSFIHGYEIVCLQVGLCILWWCRKHDFFLFNLN